MSEISKTLDAYIDTIRGLRDWLKLNPVMLDITPADPPPIPPGYRRALELIGAHAVLIETKIASLYAAMNYPCGNSPAGLLEFKRNLGMTKAQIDAHYYEESTDAE